MKSLLRLIAFTSLIGLTIPSLSQGDVPPGTPFEQLQAQVTELQTLVGELATDNSALEAQVAELTAALNAEVAARIAADNALQADLDAVEANTVLALDGLLTYDDTTMTAKFSSVNLQVVNGAGSTDSINGLGNLIVGYDADRALGSEKTGSHNMVIGDAHNYTRFGGLVAGFRNAIYGDWASVSGGTNSAANGATSSVSGGSGNIAFGKFSSVSGGSGNIANGEFSSVSGGWNGTAEGDLSSISGGFLNTASGAISSVSGGRSNIANGELSSVSGGRSNMASGDWASILGGSSQATSTADDTIPALP